MQIEAMPQAWLETEAGLQMLCSSAAEFLVAVVCSRCGGSGRVIDELCRECGTSPVTGRHVFRVPIAKLMEAVLSTRKRAADAVLAGGPHGG